MPKVKSKLALFLKRGLRALLPTVLTIGVLVVVYNFFSKYIVEPVNSGIETFLIDTRPGNSLLDSVFDIDVKSEDYRITDIEHRDYSDDGENVDWGMIERDLDRVYPRFIGFVFALILVFVTGFLLATFVGKRFLNRFEGWMSHFPIIKIIYPYARQIVDFLMRERTVKFQSVVVIEYPRKGAYSVGFLTGLGFKKLNEVTGDTFVNVFVPSSPTPLTGWVILMRADEVIPMPITVDEAARYCISGGVLVPESQKNADDILDRFRKLQIPKVPAAPSSAEPEETQEDKSSS